MLARKHHTLQLGCTGRHLDMMRILGPIFSKTAQTSKTSTKKRRSKDRRPAAEQSVKRPCELSFAGLHITSKLHRFTPGILSECARMCANLARILRESCANLVRITANLPRILCECARMCANVLRMCESLRITANHCE